MGMYTELILGARLKKNTPESVINTLRYMMGEIEKPVELLFDSDRNPLRGGSYYFAINDSVGRMWFDDISRCWTISSRSNIKNYEGEIESFLEWLKPYIDQGSGNREMYAIKMYEEQSEPTIYYLDEQ